MRATCNMPKESQLDKCGRIWQTWNHSANKQLVEKQVTIRQMRNCLVKKKLFSKIRLFGTWNTVSQRETTWKTRHCLINEKTYGKWETFRKKDRLLVKHRPFGKWEPAWQMKDHWAIEKVVYSTCKAMLQMRTDLANMGIYKHCKCTCTCMWKICGKWEVVRQQEIRWHMILAKHTEKL